MRHQLTHRAHPSRSPRGPRRRGFTLIELLVTIGIMIFVLGITVVAFGPMFRMAGVKSASRILRGAVDGARIRAIQQRRTIRFEAQLMPGTTVHQWRVCPNGGDQTQEWRELPPFVAVSSNAGSAGTGTDGRGGTYRGAIGTSEADEGTGNVQRIALTFGPDGALKRWVLGGVRDATNGTYPNVASNSTPDSTFAVRLTSMRDTQAGQKTQRWLVVIPITGGIQPFDAESEAF